MTPGFNITFRLEQTCSSITSNPPHLVVVEHWYHEEWLLAWWHLPLAIIVPFPRHDRAQVWGTLEDLIVHADTAGPAAETARPDGNAEVFVFVEG